MRPAESERPAGGRHPDDDRADLFVYGTLMDPEIMYQASGGRYASEPARLVGYVRKTVQGEVYPAIIRRAAGVVCGLVYHDLATPDLLRLDRFEGLLYERKIVSVRGARRSVLRAYAYVLSPAHRSRLSEDDWHYGEFLKTGRSAFLRTFPG